jgi:hypothetical protein
MKKADIKPGVVYAYQRGRGDYDEPQPIVFLNAPADGDLYARSSYHRPPGAPAFHAAHDGSKPHRGSGYSSPDVGYPAVMLGGNAPKGTKPEDLLKFTLAGFKAATSTTAGDGTMFTLITSLAQITGTYAEAKAEYEARRQARREEAQQERTAADASRARAIDVLASLRAHDIEANRIPAYSAVDSITLPLDEAEKLIALLAAKDTQEG